LANPGPNPLEAVLEKLDHERRRAAAMIIRETTQKLSNDDQLLLRLVYGSGHSAAAAAKTVGLSPPQARKRLKGLLIKLKQELLAQGIREA
jgi:DNA-directed RNA polymerase specialized sigma24 family protein